MNDIKVIKYDWNNKGCYLGCITYGELKKLINFKSDKTVNRDVNPNRVKEIYEYIKENTINTFFPPIILNTFSKICYETNKNSINTKGLSIKIIDGQHRINAILKVIEDDGDKFLNYKVPFLLIEELSEIMSRDIFNLVNTYQAKVEDNVADRLTPSVKCNILLKYISESKEKDDLQNIIEWNEKQADINKKVVFNHITQCIDILDKALIKVLPVYKNNDIRYKDEEYYKYFHEYLDKLVKFYLDIDIKKDENHIWITKATLLALTKLIKKRILSVNQLELVNNDKISKLHKCIEETLDELLIKDLNFEYTSKFKTGTEWLNKLLIYFNFNRKLINSKIEQDDKKLSEFKLILEKEESLEEFECDFELL
ncbi:DGQHR domain-containing protein [Clostridium sp. ZBS3]|uniref:DGQHR domain-containing protein n=1 Tax=Clostridium sp. ZBS3 TaxID=2949975 RepID=UPI000A173528|nr:DGQHR domain-containing protein [Clostridium sp. ZBS3]